MKIGFDDMPKVSIQIKELKGKKYLRSKCITVANISYDEALPKISLILEALAKKKSITITTSEHGGETNGTD